MYSNREILAAVLTKWAEPVIQEFVGAKMGTLPFVANIEQKLKASGWVSPMWSVGSEFGPLLSKVAAPVVEPLVAQYLSGFPDEAIPQMVHSIVENAVKQGSLSLFEGKVEFEKEDLEELQKLLRYNLPIKKTMGYQVLTEELKVEN
jgi:hypothetical protein